MQVEINIYLCVEPNKVVYPVFNDNVFKDITVRNLKDIEELETVSPKAYYYIESMIDSGSAVINEVNEYTVYSNKGAYANPKTLYKIPKRVFEDFHNLANGSMKPSTYKDIYEYTFKLDDEQYYSDISGEINIYDIIKSICIKQNKSLPDYLQENNIHNNQSEGNLDSVLYTAINAMSGD